MCAFGGAGGPGGQGGGAFLPSESAGCLLGGACFGFLRKRSGICIGHQGEYQAFWGKSCSDSLVIGERASTGRYGLGGGFAFLDTLFSSVLCFLPCSCPFFSFLLILFHNFIPLHLCLSPYFLFLSRLPCLCRSYSDPCSASSGDVLDQSWGSTRDGGKGFGSWSFRRSWRRQMVQTDFSCLVALVSH